MRGRCRDGEALRKGSGVVDGGEGGAAAWEGDGVVAVLTFVGGDHNGGVFGGALDSLLYCALAVCATVVAPAKI